MRRKQWLRDSDSDYRLVWCLLHFVFVFFFKKKEDHNFIIYYMLYITLFISINCHHMVNLIWRLMWRQHVNEKKKAVHMPDDERSQIADHDPGLSVIRFISVKLALFWHKPYYCCLLHTHIWVRRWSTLNGSRLTGAYYLCDSLGQPVTCGFPGVI